MSRVELISVSKSSGSTVALHEVNLEVREGEFLTLLGPSGCGKTTLLRLIAGFETPDAGTVLIGGQPMNDVPPYRRDVNQVFQSYALFPHLSVRENIAFGLRRQRRPRAEIDARVAEAIALVSLTGCEERRPDQLSGGQRQRVALARALAPQPAVLLLDEPLSALDARLRQAMQLELKRLQRQVGTTFVFVTHDQEEALTMSDRVALINRGQVEQCGDVHELYHAPATAFAAEFLGAANILEVEAIARDGDVIDVRAAGVLRLRARTARWPDSAASAKVAVRAEKIRLTTARPASENAFSVRIEQRVFKGAVDHFVVSAGNGLRLTTVAANAATGGRAAEGFRVGDQVWAQINAGDIVVVR